MQCRKCSQNAPVGAAFCPYCGSRLNATKPKGKPRTRPNGSGTAYKRGKTWTAQVTTGFKTVTRDGKTCVQAIRATKGGFGTKRDALAYCPKLYDEARGRTARQAKPTLTMRQIYDLWQTSHENTVTHSTMNCYRAAWKYFAPLHDVTFADIDLDDLQECVDDCSCGKRTKENMKALAGLLMKYAIPRHQTDLNYALYIRTGNEKKGTHPAFTPEQVEAIRALIGKFPHAEYVYCLIYTGLRPAEFVSLKKNNLKDGILYCGIKTAAGIDRAVPVSPKILPYITARAAIESDYLFPKDDGTRLTTAYFREQYFYPVIDAAGIQPIPTEDSPAYYVPYSCRHTFANMLKSAAGSDKDKAALIGHEDYTTTKKHYQSAELDALKRIVDSI